MGVTCKPLPLTDEAMDFFSAGENVADVKLRQS